jgi:putative thioredoxin
MLGPVLERLASEPNSTFILAKVDVDANPGLSMRYNVRGIPAVKAFRDGKVAAEFVGAQPEPKVRQFIKQLVPSELDHTMETAEDLIARRRWDEAEKTYRQLLATNPAQANLKLGLVRTLIGQGKGCEAKDYIEDLLSDTATMSSAELLMPLTDYVCAYSDEDSVDAELTVIEAQYRQAARFLGQGKVAPAMDGLLDVLRHNKDYRNGQARAIMLGIFELLGNDDPLTNAYRREMASILF